MRFDLRRGEAGVAYLTDSSDQGENAIIVVDLASGESWRKLRDHASTKAGQPPAFLPMVEGRAFVEQEEPEGERQPITMGSDGIATSADGARLWYCPLASRHWYRLLWPDTMSVAADGHLYVTAYQLHRQAKYRAGTDERRYPYALFRIPIDAGPVRLR